MGLALPHWEARALPRFLTPGLFDERKTTRERKRGERLCEHLGARLTTNASSSSQAGEAGGVDAVCGRGRECPRPPLPPALPVATH